MDTGYYIILTATLGGSVFGATTGVGLVGALLKKKGNLLFAAMGASVGIIPSLALGVVSAVTFSLFPGINSDQMLWVTSGITAIGIGSLAVLGYHFGQSK